MKNYSYSFGIWHFFRGLRRMTIAFFSLYRLSNCHRIRKVTAAWELYKQVVKIIRERKKFSCKKKRHSHVAYLECATGVHPCKSCSKSRTSLDPVYGWVCKPAWSSRRITETWAIYPFDCKLCRWLLSLGHFALAKFPNSTFPKPLCRPPLSSMKFQCKLVSMSWSDRCTMPSLPLTERPVDPEWQGWTEKYTKIILLVLCCAFHFLYNKSNNFLFMNERL